MKTAILNYTFDEHKDNIIFSKTQGIFHIIKYDHEPIALLYR